MTGKAMKEYGLLDNAQVYIAHFRENPNHICFKCERMWEKIYKNGEINIDMRMYSIGYNYCDILNFKKPCSQPMEVELSKGYFWSKDNCDRFEFDKIIVTKCGDFELHNGNEIYEAYIWSDFWQEKRIERLRKDGFKCCMCGTAKNLRVHHVTYENLINENVDDLITLCDSCHKTVHSEDLKER